MDLLARLLTVTLQLVDEGVPRSSTSGAVHEVLPRQPLRWRLTLSFENEDGSKSATAAAFLAEVGECDMHAAWSKLFRHLLLTPFLTVRREGVPEASTAPAVASSLTPCGEATVSETPRAGCVARFDFGPFAAPALPEAALASRSSHRGEVTTTTTAAAVDDTPSSVLTGPTRVLTAVETTVTPVFATTQMGVETGSPPHMPRVVVGRPAGRGDGSATATLAHEMPAAVTSVFYFDFTIPDVPSVPEAGTLGGSEGGGDERLVCGGPHRSRDPRGAVTTDGAGATVTATAVELVFALLMPANEDEAGASKAASPQTASSPLTWPSDGPGAGCAGQGHRMYALLARSAAEARGTGSHAVPAWLALRAIPIGACTVPLLLRRALSCHSVTCPLGNDQLLLSLNITNRSPLPVVLHGANFDLHATELARDAESGDGDGRVGAMTEFWSEHRPGPRRVDMRTIDLLTKVITVTPMVVSDDRPPFTLYPQETYSFQFVLQVVPQLCYLLNSHSLEHVYRQMHVCAPAEEPQGGAHPAPPLTTAAVSPVVARGEASSGATRPAEAGLRVDETQPGLTSSTSAMLPVRDCYGAAVTAEEILAVLSAAYTSYLFVYYYYYYYTTTPANTTTTSTTATTTPPPPPPSAGRRPTPLADSGETKTRCRRPSSVISPTVPQGGVVSEVNGLHLRHAARWSFGVMK